VPKHHKTIVRINPIEFEDLKERLTKTADASGVKIVEFVVDDKHKLVHVTFRSEHDEEFETVVAWVREDDFGPYQVGPINLDDRFNV
jgi:hypothetical protein